MYICIYVYVCIYIYIYIYLQDPSETYPLLPTSGFLKAETGGIIYICSIIAHYHYYHH